MIFDAHVHLGKKRFFDKENEILHNSSVNINILENTWEKYAKVAAKYGVYKALIFPFPLANINIEAANNYVMEAHKKNQELFIPFLLISEDIIKKNLSTDSIMGVKEHFYLTGDKDTKCFFAIYDFLQENNLFLFIHPHMKERMDRIRLIIDNFPRLKIIWAHSGRKWPFSGEDVVELIVPQFKEYSNIIFETSTIRDSSVVTAMVKDLGSDRILFGTDYPISEQGEDIYLSEIAVIQDAKITESDKVNIFYNNFRNLFLKDVWIRKVSKLDKKNIFGLFATLTKTERKFLALDQKLELIKSNIRDERHIFLLENKKDIIGYIRESGREDKGAFLEEIIINKDYRGRGYARILQNVVINKFRYVELKTFADNISVNRLNEKMGFNIFKKSANGSIYYWRKINDEF